VKTTALLNAVAYWTKVDGVFRTPLDDDPHGTSVALCLSSRTGKEKFK
jgi:hypothetical protein